MFRKWWFWVILGFGLIVIMCAASGILTPSRVEEVETIEETTAREEKEFRQVKGIGEAKMPLVLGEAIEYKVSDMSENGEIFERGIIRIGIIDYKFTNSYESELDGISEAPDGVKYLWIYIKSENVGKDEGLALDLPFSGNFDLLYKGKDIRNNLLAFDKLIDEPTYIGKVNAYPGYGDEGWAIFEISEGTRLEDVRIRFKENRLFDEAVECYWELGK